MKAIGYMRVSTEEQSREGISLGHQRAKIQAYCNLHDLDLVDMVEDAGISGKSIQKRPGIQAVMKMVAQKRVDAVVIYKLDRMARNTIEALMMVEEMEKAGVALHSITESLDTKSAIGRFVVRIMAALAEMERDLIAERTRDALAGKKANGGRVGLHAHRGFGLMGDRLVPDRREQEAIRLAKDLRKAGTPFRGIANALAERGYMNRAGKPFQPTAVKRMVMG